MLVVHLSPLSRCKRRKDDPSLPCFPWSLLLLLLFLLLPLQPSARLAKPSSRLPDPYDENMVQVLLDYSAAAYYCRTSACETWLCRCERQMGGWGGQGRHVYVALLPCFPDVRWPIPYPKCALLTLSISTQCLPSASAHAGDACVRQRAQWEWLRGMGP